MYDSYCGDRAITSGLYLGKIRSVEELETLHAGALSQGHHTIDRLEKEKTAVENLPRKEEEIGLLSITPTLKLFNGETSLGGGTSLETGWSAYGISKALNTYHLELN